MDWKDLLEADSPDALVERLRRRFEERRASLGADPGATADDAASARTPADTRATPAGQEPDAGSLGERARAHFADLEERERKQARLTRDLLDALRPERAAELGTAPPQRLLELHAEAGAVTGGAFVVENASAVTVALSFEVVGVRDGLGVSRAAPPIAFEPSAPSLAPREARRVRVRIDLADAPSEPGARLELQVRVHADGRHHLTLWIDVVVDPRTFE